MEKRHKWQKEQFTHIHNINIGGKTQISQGTVYTHTTYINVIAKSRR